MCLSSKKGASCPCPSLQIIDNIFAFLNKKNLVPVNRRVYNFEDILDAVAARDEGKVNGKITARADHSQSIAAKYRDGEAK